jgi:two-component system, NarL family, response regulator DesR
MGALLLAEVRRLFRSPRFLIFTVGFPVVYLIVFTGIFATGPDAAAATVVLMVNMAAFGAISASISTGGRVAVERSMRAGAAGFVVKDAPPEQLVDAVRRVHAGLRVVDPILAAESLSSGTSPLTDRERDVLVAAADGATVAAVAARLHLSEGTVRNHLSAAIGKTSARTRAGAVRLADERGWL